MKTSKEDVYQGRGIHNPEFLKSLKAGKLQKMLSVINNDKDLDVQIRNNYLNIYYLGGNIAKVNSENSVEFDKFYFYLDMDKIPKKNIEDDHQIISELNKKKEPLIKKFKAKDYEGYFEEAKKVMDKWMEKNPKPERMEQHNLSIENKFGKSDYTIIDLEYQVSIRSKFACEYKPKGNLENKKPRFDIIAISKQGKLCVIELKKGSGALENTSGLEEHWLCYEKSIGRDTEAFMNEMRKILEQKKDFGLIDKRLEIKSNIPEFMFAYSYDNKTTIKEQDDKFNSVYSKINEPIQVIKLPKGTLRLLDK